MARITDRKTEANRAAIYARVSDKSQDGEDKTSISEQIGEMEAYCENKGLTITARYHEVGRGWTKKRPEFQRMLADAKRGRFDTIVCWKSDRLSRGMYLAAALMEVVEAHQIRLDAIDMKTFGLMAAIGKIELDNFRERSTMGKRGTAKQGRVPTGGLPYGYRIGDDSRFEVVEEQAEVVRRIFRMYVDERMGSYSIAVRLTDEGVPTQSGKMLWLQSRVHHILGNATYTGTWVYGKYRHVSTEDGMKVYDQPKDTWIEIPVPQVIDDENLGTGAEVEEAAGQQGQEEYESALPVAAPAEMRRVRPQLPCEGELDNHQRSSPRFDRRRYRRPRFSGGRRNGGGDRPGRARPASTSGAGASATATSTSGSVTSSGDGDFR